MNTNLTLFSGSELRPGFSGNPFFAFEKKIDSEL